MCLSDAIVISFLGNINNCTPERFVVKPLRCSALELNGSQDLMRDVKVVALATISGHNVITSMENYP